MTLAALPAAHEVNPCPFCKGRRVRVHEWSQRGKQFAVQCVTTSCGALGPRRYDEAAAVDAWNCQEVA